MSATGPVGNKVFAPAIFFIAFREALEAALVIGILTGMLERVVDVRNDGGGADRQGRALIKRLRKYIFLGAGCGLLVAFAIGAAFLAVFYTQTTDLYGRSEELWEGIFNLIAVALITPMSLAILRADRSRAKWRKKLAKAFAGLQNKQKADAQSAAMLEISRQDSASQHSSTNAEAQRGTADEVDAITRTTSAGHHDATSTKDVKLNSSEKATSSASDSDAQHVLQSQNATAAEPVGKLSSIWTMIKRPFDGETRSATAIFIIPFITTLREGLEGVVFIGGVSLGLPATSIPLPAIVGLAAGLLCGFVVFKAGSFSKVRFFLVFSTCFLLVIAAGMFSRSVYYLQFYKYVRLVGDAAAESGSGPGSYNALDYVWHLNCCNPEDKTNGGSGWAILNSLVGWNNTATTGTILSYIFYWLAVMSYLVYSHFREQRAKQAAVRKTRATS